MKSNFIFVCALAGAMVSFGLNIAQSAPVPEPTNLAALLKKQNQDKSDAVSKPTGKQSAKKQTGKKSSQTRSKAGVKKSSKSPYSQLINRYASTYGVPSALAHAVVRHESNFRPNVRGAAGEIGLMQIKLSTARGLGYSGSAKALYEPATNVQYGMKYLAMAHKLGGGSTCGTILKYNAGHGAKRMNPTSAKYCNNVQAYMRSF